MNLIGLKFHHLGLATTNHKKAIEFLKGLQYTIGKSIYDPIQNVNLILCTHIEFPDIEVIYSETGKEDKSPLNKLFEFQNELFYHICYTTTDLNYSLERIRKLGLRIFQIAPREKAKLFNNKKVSFYKIVGFGIIEILEI